MEKFQFQDGGMLVSPDSSTPASSSPIDLLTHLLNDNDDDYEKSTTTSSGDRSQRPSDEEDDNYHLPLFKRGTVNYRYSGTSSNGDSGFSSSTASFSGLDFSSFRSNTSSASTDLSPPVKDYPSPTFDPFQAFSGNQNVRFNGTNQSFCDNLKMNALLPSRSQQTSTAPFDFDLFSSSDISSSIAAIGHERSTVPKYNNPTSNLETDTQTGDLNILHQAVSLAAMSLNDKDATDALASQQALANIAALAQIDEAQNQLQPLFHPPPAPAHNFGRQFSFPPEQAFHPPPPMFGRAHQNPMSAYGFDNSWKNDLYQGGPNYNGMMGGTNNGHGPSQIGRPPFRPSLSSPAGEFGDFMQIRCKFGQLGVAPSHFNAPHGFCIGRSEEIVVADTNNHRIQVFDKLGNFRFAFGRPGKEDGCLWHPRKVAVLRNNGHFVVCDRGIEPSRMQVFNERGMFLRRVCIRFVKIVAGLATTSDGSVVIVDSVIPTIFVIDPENGKALRYLECAEFMIEPSDIAVFKDDFYICDFKGHSVVVVSSDGQFLRKIKTDSVTRYPNGIDISDAGDILVGDSHGNQFHVAIFDRYGQFVSHFHCPQVKVSRCCGLKITSEGFIVTLAKNNHHVLVLNTLYVA